MHAPEQSAAPTTIGFPPQQLGPQPARLAVLAWAPGILALEKPVGIAWDATTPDAAVLPALRAQLASGKPELAPFALERPASVWPLETEIAGVGLIVSRGAALEFWRNTFGSALIQFTYELLVRANTTHPPWLECTLPIATHRDGSRAVISHETGRKSHTIFQRNTAPPPDKNAGAQWEWWTATTNYPRFHQIRIHAAECGLQIAGEILYAARTTTKIQAAALPVPLPRVEDFRPRGRLNKGEVAPLLAPPALRLANVTLPPFYATTPPFPACIAAPPPRKWLALRKRLP